MSNIIAGLGVVLILWLIRVVAQRFRQRNLNKVQRLKKQLYSHRYLLNNPGALAVQELLNVILITLLTVAITSNIYINVAGDLMDALRRRTPLLKSEINSLDTRLAVISAAIVVWEIVVMLGPLRSIVMATMFGEWKEKRLVNSIKRLELD